MGCIMQCSYYTVNTTRKLFLRPLSHSSRERRASKGHEPADRDGLASRSAAASQPLGVCGAAHAQGLGGRVVSEAHVGLPGAEVVGGHEFPLLFSTAIAA